MLRLLALDLSLTAVGICTPDMALSTFKPKTEDDERLDEIAAHVRDVAIKHEVVLAVMEEAAFVSHSAGILGLVHGAVRLQFMRKQLPYVLIPPASLKKYATGSGKAVKADMRMAWFKHTNQDIGDDNQVDAAWLMAMALDFYGDPRFKVPTANRVVMGNLDWPELKRNPRRQCAGKCRRTDAELPPGVVWVGPAQCSDCYPPTTPEPIGPVVEEIVEKVRQTPIDHALHAGQQDDPDETVADQPPAA